MATAAELFTRVALSDPISTILLLLGALFVGVSVLALGYLTIGAVVEFVTPDLS